MGASGGGTETVTQNSEPWSQAQPYLKDIFSQAQNQYRQGQEYYPGSTVVPFSPDTQQGINGLREQYQGSPTGFDAASGTLTNLAGSTGANNPFMSEIKTAGDRQNTAGNGVLNEFANSNQSNPYLDQTFDKAADKVSNNVNAMFSGSGRYGSGAHQGVMGDTMGDLATSVYGGAYESDANRRFGAAEALGAREAGDINRQFTSANARAGLGQATNSQAMQAASMLPGMDQYGQSNNHGLMQLGAGLEAQAGAELQDSMNRWNFGQNAGWDQLQRYNQTVQPIAGLGGQSTQTQPGQKGPSLLQNAAGIGMMGASIFSDWRLKTDIKKIGTRRGFDWYSFRYNWDKPGTVHHGVMAQDVKRVRPDAVTTNDSGHMLVNYSLLELSPVMNANDRARKIIERGLM